MEKPSTLGLQLPERTNLPGSSFLANPREVETWISGLPMANIGETSRQVFKMIVEFNRVEIQGTARIKIAELLRQPIRYISDNLRRHYFDTTFPLSAKSHKTAVLNRELYIELATAYKIFIEETLSGKIRKFDKKHLIIAIHRALHNLSLVLYQSIIFYDPYPRSVWYEIHRLYAYAEENRFHQLQIKEDGAGGQGSSSIEELYQRILLFAISSPYRLRQPDIERVYNQLPAWTKQVVITIPGQKKESDTLFVARLDEDAPPTHIKLHPPPLDRGCRQIDTGSLVTLLNNVLESIPSEQSRTEHLTSEDLISRNLLQKLIATFSSAPERRFVRTQLNFELNMATGLAAIHGLLPAQSGQPDTPPAATPEDAEAHHFGQLLDDIGPRINAPGNFVLSRQSEASLGMMDDPPEESIVMATPDNGNGDVRPAWAKTTGSGTAATFTCKTNNESAGGFCILWHGPEVPRIKVGEIIGIQSASRESEFAIGISRWLRSIPGSGLQVGMEMIAPKSKAVLGTCSNNNRPSNSAQKCLLLEAGPKQKTKKIIAPPLAFRVGDQLQLEGLPQEHEIRLTALVESTGAFALFECITINRLTRAEHRSDEDDFDSIWSSL